jgi:hypothetical protein
MKQINLSQGKLNTLIKLSRFGRIDMLRLIFVALLIAGFIYTSLEVRHGFAELQYQRVSQIERAIGE